MRIYSPDQQNIFLEADTLEDAIELQSLSGFSFASRVGIAIETRRNQFFRVIVPARPRKPSQYPDFNHWFDLWDRTKDPEVKRVCFIAWRAALAYAYAPAEENACADSASAPGCQKTVAPYWNTARECTSETCNRPLPCAVHDHTGNAMPPPDEIQAKS
jgi:hypothetical protein